MKVELNKSILQTIFDAVDGIQQGVYYVASLSLYRLEVERELAGIAKVYKTRLLGVERKVVEFELKGRRFIFIGDPKKIALPCSVNKMWLIPAEVVK